ncbi:hypothetical protein [Umezawaea sp. Da 62-37]|uniref:hypothetical protein n=1 Tax=Umezawaea sp. Da 62-37 TaxID=3075927 RepID=UPI0028F742AB|nr:hypothetical protein [Umezawaea sp. Da 62-37]WNV82703.1 hypothetical protein RM788_31465 [Umezawaea sp. Da 62-37]
MTPPIDASHHSSHRQLLTTVGGSASRLDAIIVPTNRTPDHLDAAMDLARELRCTLLLLCSQNASVGLSESLAAQRGVDLIAVDVDRLPDDLMPAFRTSALLLANGFERRTDTSLKRNLGLLFARAAGWQRVVFLDDDIKVPSPSDLGVAAGLADSYAGVGLAIGGFEDNSVVCHALREVGAFQDTFIGGGALAIGAHSMTSFFPNVYNEDWFFLLDDDGLRRTAMTGVAEQEEYDPFADPARARTEEFGDCLAEGLFALFDDGRGIRDADVDYWDSFLRSRHRLIVEVLGKVADPVRGRERTRRMTASLSAARDRCLRIAPRLCVDYLAALAEDRIVWHTFVRLQPVLDGPEAAMAALGLVGAHRQHPSNPFVVEVGGRAGVHDLARV